jgi:integrase
MGRPTKIGLAVRVKETAKSGVVSYPRYEVTFKNGKPYRCRRTADSPEIPIPGDGSFYITHPKDAQGARVTPVGAGLDEAVVKYRQFEATAERAKRGLTLLDDFVKHTPNAPANRSLIATAIEKYLAKVETSGKSTGTHRAYKGALDDFVKSCDKTFIDELTEDDMVGYLAWMKKNVKRRSVGQQNITFRKRLGFVNTFLSVHGKKNLWSSKEWPKFVRKAPDRYTSDQISAILGAALPEEKIRLLFFFYSGCRDMEVATAEFSDINPKSNIFTIQAKPHLKWKPKTDTERSQVLPKAFVKELMERKATRKKGNNLIFPNTVGNVDNNMIEFLQKAAKRAGITERVTLHKIRRTAISHAIDKFGVRKAMAFAGHTDIATTNKYSAPDDMTSPAVRNQVEESFEELVAGGKK